jgi:hypothetical protein
VEAYARDFGDQGDQGARSDERQFVGIDLHRRRSVIVRMDAAGDVLEVAKIVNDVHQLGKVISRAGRAPAVVLEATYGWYWAVDALQAAGAEVHLAHPLGVKAFEYRRVKNDEGRLAGSGPLSASLATYGVLACWRGPVQFLEDGGRPARGCWGPVSGWNVLPRLVRGLA